MKIRIYAAPAVKGLINWPAMTKTTLSPHCDQNSPSLSTCWWSGPSLFHLDPSGSAPDQTSGQWSVIYWAQVCLRDLPSHTPPSNAATASSLQTSGRHPLEHCRKKHSIVVIYCADKLANCNFFCDTRLSMISRRTHDVGATGNICVDSTYIAWGQNDKTSQWGVLFVTTRKPFF